MSADYLKSVGPERAFTLKRGSGEVVGTVSDLEGLRNALSEVPDDVILFHMEGRNDFATWVGDVISCDTLSRFMRNVPEPCDEVGETRRELLHSLDLAVDLLKEAKCRKRTRGGKGRKE